MLRRAAVQILTLLRLMKLELKPGVSPAFFWTTIGLGAASTAASALALTSYAWAGMAGALIALIVGFVRNNVKPPPGAALLLLLAFCVSLIGCVNGPVTKGDAVTFGRRVAIAAGEMAVSIARLELAIKTQAWLDAQTQGDPVKVMVAQIAMEGAKQALDLAERALAKEAAKLNAKQPRDVTPRDQADVPDCLQFPPPAKKGAVPPLSRHHETDHLVSGTAPNTRDCGAFGWRGQTAVELGVARVTGLTRLTGVTLLSC